MLKGEKTAIRNIGSADLGLLIQRWADLSARGDHFPLNILNETTIKKHYQDNGFWSESGGHMVIIDLEGRIVGAIFFMVPNPFLSYLEVGYILFDAGDRGKGYTSEALGLFSQFLLSTKQISKILLNITLCNTSSRKVAEKNGFVSEGVDKKALFLRGEYRDAERFALYRKNTTS